MPSQITLIAQVRIDLHASIARFTFIDMSSLKRKRGIKSNPYQSPCTFCTRDETCEPCLSSATCQSCTSTARCGSCRNLYSRHRRSLSNQTAVQISQPKVGSATASCIVDPSLESLDLPRSREGLAPLDRRHPTLVACSAAPRPSLPSRPS